MQQTDLLKKSFRDSEQVSRFLARAFNGESFAVSGLAGSAISLLLEELFARKPGPLLAITPTEKLASAIANDLRELFGNGDVYSFPVWGIHPYDWLTPPAENSAQRIEAAWRLSQGGPALVVASAIALIQPTVAPDDLKAGCFQLCLEQEYDLEEIVAKLARIGYERKPITEEVGTFSVRGGILDLFPYTSENPIRAEFFGDRIESMRCFSVMSQRSIESVDRVTIIPRRELLWPDSELEARVDRLERHAGEFLRDKCLNGFGYPGLEWLRPLLGGKLSYLFDYLPEQSFVYIKDSEAIRSQIEERLGMADRLRQDVAEKLPAAPRPEEIYLDEQQFFAALDNRQQISEISIGSAPDSIRFGMKEHPALNGQVSLLRDRLRGYLADEIAVFITADSEPQAERFREFLSEFSEDLHFVISQLHSGFEFADARMVLLTDHQIFQRRLLRRRHRKFKEGTAISSYAALSLGDYVVHVDYGIGRYRGLVDISIGGRKRECLLIKYADDGKLYVPIEEFSRVQKYIGKDGRPALTRLGGKTWDKLKAKTKKAIADLAKELLRIYAERKTKPGFAFAKDDEWMHQLEASFPYEETPDQREAIAAIKKDMEQPTPTERLVCGDVGFGKTEVAVRAALKAVTSGKQVAILVPTTILAQQHLATFQNRLQQFPARIEMLSRFKSRQEQKAIVADLRAGKVDIVIGTHRLLQKDLEIPNLGLLIVDEEHRFGVAHKERLRKIRTTVDSLALSATPIPRTLHMSLLSVRDISLINTPPKFRQPIVTDIAEFDPKIIHEAINDEIARNGQVYFVHNRVQSIVSMYHYLTKLISPIRIAVAHGQMPEKELEEVMLAFLAGYYDVLLSTSIIESGIDIPSVNTIIINRADRFGLAQLYQLRGRVGRSLERAYAYLLVPPTRLLTDTARKRLKAIEQHTELGSGFQLAMRDLEIRGAGNLLGPQQHGHMEEVGFDLYCRLLEETVAELKGEPLPRPKEVKVECDADIYIPDYYVEDATQRVEIYRKISDARKADDLRLVRAELIDRFGKYEPPVERLLDLMELKLLAAEREIDRIKLLGQKLALAYRDGHLPSKRNIERFRAAAPDMTEFDVSQNFVIRVTFPDDCRRPLAEAKKLLQTL